ncbi:G-protein coupled receptor Mth2-like isoform X2 [Anthonomus grandis grandis]|uniref:G-protein coupled receptor Mth2-like isoform X2 n=1 Tax=Anthonomus grandis grandis TaxID=2921223 RepID=UPI002165E5F5|nr:G-protein coupled receptor Mth2-like isoform X2 [Anthonomus grandis grandis]
MDDYNNLLLKTGDMLMLISIALLSLTVLIYAYLKLTDLQEICLMHILCGRISEFALIQILFNFNIVSDQDLKCRLCGIMIYFSSIYVYWWLLILTFHIWTKTSESDITFKRLTWCQLYHLIGTLGPLFCLTVALVAEYHPSEIFDEFRPSFIEFCWFSGKKEAWIFFYGPVVIILCAILVLSICIIRNLSKKPNRPLKSRACMGAKLNAIMGLLWFMGQIQYKYYEFFERSEVLKVLFIDIPHILNMLQGWLAFLILVVYRVRIRKLLAQKTFCCYLHFPRSWTALVDKEMEGETEPASSYQPT